MDPNALLVSALINIIVGIVKGFPKIQNHYLPIIAIGLGAIIWPLYLGVFSGAVAVTGCLVGAGAVGLYEVAAGINKSKKEVAQTTSEIKNLENLHP